MPKRSFSIPLDETTRLHLFLSRERGLVVSFVVKLDLFRDGRWAEVQRCDTHLTCVHKDVLTRAGKKRRTIRFNYPGWFYGLHGFDPGLQGKSRNLYLEVGAWRSRLEK